MRAEDGPVADRAPIYRVKRLSNVVACGGHHLAGVGAARRHGRKRRIRHAQLVCLGLYRAGQLVDLPARGPLAVAANRRLLLCLGKVGQRLIVLLLLFVNDAIQRLESKLLGLIATFHALQVLSKQVVAAGAEDDLVVDVGHIHHEGAVIAEIILQNASNNVKREVVARMSDVCDVINCGSAGVPGDLLTLRPVSGHEWHLLVEERVI
mmetsp:Transcript_23007/g.68421  ORF Transcript_23007/g.68421 Transcript_23007/m.68421 type:complete len:208 (+) Transcript_23007:872-1495(+)